MLRPILLLACTISVGHTQSVPDLAVLLDPDGNVGRLQELSWSATGEMFDPAQTIVAGSRSRHITSYGVDGTWRPGGSADYDWRLNIHYPFPSIYEYSESMDESGGGEIDGSDGFRPSAAGALPGARVGARDKFLAMTVPAVVLADARNVEPVSGFPGSYDFEAMSTSWRVHVDPDSVVTSLSTTERDPLFGSVQSTMHYADWRRENGVSMPGRFEYRVDGQLIQQEQRSELRSTLAPRSLDVDHTPPLEGADYARGWSMAHWFLRRIALGGPADTDQSYPVELLEVGGGVYQALGSSHHTLVVETDNGFVIVDAPLYPSRSEAILETLSERWPDRPVRRVILTHHHYDHSGGIMAYAAAGIPIATHAANLEFFASAFGRQGISVPVEGVRDRTELTIDGRRFGLYDVPTSHVAGMLMVYLPDERLVYNSDLYSPGRATQHQLWASELLQAVRFLGLPVEHFVGAHGRGPGTMAELARVVSGR